MIPRTVRLLGKRCVIDNVVPLALLFRENPWAATLCQFVCPHRIKHSSIQDSDNKQSWLWPAGVRAFRADTPDAEHRVEDICDDRICSTSGNDATGTSPRGIANSVPHPETLLRPRQGPVRVPQPTQEGQRRKVLSPGDNDFMGNVASLLVRSPSHAFALDHKHQQQQRMPRTWQEVVDSPRFQQLFPRRNPPLSDEAIRGLQALAAAAAPGSSTWDAGADGATSSSGGPSGSARASAADNLRQEAIQELMERLQAVQQYLQDNMPEDDGSGNGPPTTTIVAVATFDDDSSCSTSGDDGEEEELDYPDFPADRSTSVSSRGSPTRDTGWSYRGAKRAAEAGGSGGSGGWGEGGPEDPRGRRRGRRRHYPGGGGRQGGKAPAPPWDDTQPFQTAVGTVYHFWRLCPYG